MGHYKRILGIGVFILLFMISGFMMYQYQGKVKALEQKNAALSHEVKNLNQKTSENNALITNLKNQVQQRDEKIRILSMPSEQPVLIILQNKGFTGGTQDIIADLIMHPELIPYEGVVGGVMGFYDQKSIQVLSDQWVFAPFNDGHIGGSMLLKYDWNNGKFSWKVIDSYLY